MVADSTVQKDLSNERGSPQKSGEDRRFFRVLGTEDPFFSVSAHQKKSGPQTRSQGPLSLSASSGRVFSSLGSYSPGRRESGIERIAKSTIRDFLLHGKGKAWFSLSSRIHNSSLKSWIRAPRAGRFTRVAKSPLRGFSLQASGISQNQAWRMEALAADSPFPPKRRTGLAINMEE